MYLALDAGFDNQLANSVQKIVGMATRAKPSIAGTDRRVVAAARTQIIDMSNAAISIEQANASVKDALNSLLSEKSPSISQEEAAETMERISAMDGLVIATAAYTRYALHREIMPDGCIGEMKESLVSAYERVIAALDEAHIDYAMVMNFVRQFMTPSYCEGKFNPTRAELEALGDASVAMLRDIREGGTIEFV